MKPIVNLQRNAAVLGCLNNTVHPIVRPEFCITATKRLRKDRRGGQDLNASDLSHPQDHRDRLIDITLGIIIPSCPRLQG